MTENNTDIIGPQMNGMRQRFPDFLGDVQFSQGPLKLLIAALPNYKMTPPESLTQMQPAV